MRFPHVKTQDGHVTNDSGIVLGIDAGGTSTRAVAAAPDGSRLAHGRGPGGNPTAHGVAAACAAIARAVTEALANYRGSATADAPGPVLGVVAGVAGNKPFLSGDGRAALERALDGLDLAPGARIEVVDDVGVAFAAGTPEPSGTVLISGTGAVAGAVSHHRLDLIADGLGWLLGDLGSGYWLGHEAARAVVRHLTSPRTERGGTALKAREEPRRPVPGAAASPKHGTALAEPAAHSGAVAPGEVLTPLVTRAVLPDADPGLDGRDLAIALITTLQERHPLDLARLAPLVSEAAERGDPLAGDIVAEAARLLTATVAEVRPPGDRTPIVLAGSVLTTPGPVRRAVSDLLARRWDAPVTVAGHGAGAAAWLAALPLLGAGAVSAHARFVRPPASLPPAG